MMSREVLARVLRRLLSAAEAAVLFARLRAISPELKETTSLVGPALDLALQFKHSLHDSVYVALALRETCELVTAEEKLHRAFSFRIPQVHLLRQWP